MNIKLCNKTIEVCAKILDGDADGQEKVWNEYISKGGVRQATSYHTVPRDYANKIRKLKI